MTVVSSPHQTKHDIQFINYSISNLELKKRKNIYIIILHKHIAEVLVVIVCCVIQDSDLSIEHGCLFGTEIYSTMSARKT